jgi:transglutaminase-like putative cysteine protease/sugar lactone lactonase YvrE
MNPYRQFMSGARPRGVCAAGGGFGMRGIRTGWTVALGLALTAGVSVGKAAPGDVEHSFEAPCRFPAGLTWSGEALYVADWRDAKIHVVNPGTGKVERVVPAPTLKPHGLAWGDGHLYVSDDHTGHVYAMRPDTGAVDTVFEAPAEKATGLAFADGSLFILANRKIYCVLPHDGTILRYYDAPTRDCRCLAHDGRYLWVSDRIKDDLYMVDPESGRVVSMVKAPGPHALGITCQGERLWNVDFQTRRVYGLALRGKPMYQLADERRARIEHLWVLTNYGPGDVTDLRVHLAVPTDLANQKLLGAFEYTGPPAGEVTDQWGQVCRAVDIERVPAGRKVALSTVATAEVSAIRYLLIPEDTGTLDDIPQEVRTAYTVDGSRLRINSPYIRETVAKVVGDERNPYWIARKIYDHIIGQLEYQMVGGWDVPEVVLKRGSGSCSEYTYTFIALCRAAGLPARYQGALVVRGDDASIDEAFHRWAQVYFPGYGWVPVDANRGDKASAADQARGFGQLGNGFLITTQGGGGSTCLDWGYNAHSTYRLTGYCRVEQEHFGFWEPLPAADAAGVSTED